MQLQSSCGPRSRACLESADIRRTENPKTSPPKHIETASSLAVCCPRRDYNAQMGDDPGKDAPVPDRLLFLPLAADRGSGQRSWLQHLVRS